ncbi:MAG: hypothetical protein MUD14_10940 [Hydrococcus sp. Prado102]|jgi:hypothetical protein|nr:hypothetical protein [Hydrococcus sp. Prado102]
MTEELKIADAETRKQTIQKLKESNRQLELFALALEDLIAMVEADTRHQRRERLQKRAQK